MIGDKGFYNVYFPERFPTVDTKYFFFKSLYDKKASSGLRYTGETLANTVSGIISNGLIQLEQSETNNQQSMVKETLDFLLRLAVNSHQHEVQWLKDHITNNFKIPSGMREECAKFLTDSNKKSIDYIGFLHYFNICLTGLTEYTYNLKYEQERLEQLEKAWTELRALDDETEGRRLRSIARKEIKSSKEEKLSDENILVHTFIEYAQEQLSKEQSTAKFWKEILESKTLINKVADAMERIYNIIWNNPTTREAIKQKFKIRNTLENQRAIISYLIIEIVGSFRSEFNEIIDQAIQEKKKEKENYLFSENLNQNLINKFLNKIGFETDPMDTNTLNSKRIALIKERIQKMQKDEIQMTQMNTRLFKQLKITGKDEEDLLKTGGKRKTIIGLTQDMLDYIGPLLTDLNTKRKSFGRRRHGKSPTYRAYVIDLLSEAVKVGFKDSTKNDLYKITPTHKQATPKQIANLATNILLASHACVPKFTSKNNPVSEIISNNDIVNAIGGNKIANAVITPINLTKGYKKADIAVFEIGKVEIPPLARSDFYRMATQITRELIGAPHLEKNQLQYNKINNKTIEELDKEERKQEGLKTIDFYVTGEKNTRLRQMKIMIDTLKKQSQANNAKGHAALLALQSLKSSVKISDSVKSYDKYDNEIGFYGGSLGKGLVKQLLNIQRMAEAGGISFADIKWLEFAIYNVGKYLVGDSYRDELEDYLSMFAVALLFDDMGELAEYIKSISYTINSEAKDIKFLHLFFVNGFYIPASYILYLTWQELTKAYDMTMSESRKIRGTGSKIRISNPITYQDLSGRREGSRIYTTSPKDWVNTFNKNKDNVNLQMTFLAGFLDILNKLNNFNIGGMSYE